MISPGRVSFRRFIVVVIQAETLRGYSEGQAGPIYGPGRRPPASPLSIPCWILFFPGIIESNDESGGLDVTYASRIVREIADRMLRSTLFRDISVNVAREVHDARVTNLSNILGCTSQNPMGNASANF